jgi:hypothetical protein
MDGLSLSSVRGDLQDVAAALTATLVHVPDDLRAAAWQDGLDLVAVLAGQKPLCIVGRGSANEAWVDAARAIAAGAGLASLDAAPWEPQDEAALLPRWYGRARERRRARTSLLYACRGETVRAAAARLGVKGHVAPAEEAALLGYPICCVAAHHRRTLALEQLVAELAERIAKGDAAQMARMIETGAAPLPRTEQDWRRYEAATARNFAPFTAVAMCEACAADRGSPAQALSRLYEALAVRARYAPI